MKLHKKGGLRVSAGEKPKRRFDGILAVVALLSAFLNVCNIWKDQYANAYYTAAVTSMLQSFHNFFFASFDPGGFVTVDKPPVTFWVQTAFAAVFGVHGWSVVLPQALAGVGSVLLLYTQVKPTFGKTAARLAALAMALTPVAVAVSRTNNIDSLLVFTLLLGAWMLFRAVRTQKFGWVLGAFAMIGLGFNEKMLEAYMVVPAFGLYYLLAFQRPWLKKIALLAGAGAVMVAVSLSWAVTVDYLIPAADRPYVGSSQTNSVLELALGYNGVARLTGNRGTGGAPGGARTGNQDFQNAQGRADRADRQFQGTNAPPNFARSGRNGGGNPGGGFGGGGGMFNTGTPGPFRLFESSLSGQASWLLPLAAFASVALLAGVRWKKALTDKENETLFWLAWLLPVGAFFSVAGFFHQYYLIMLAPPIAALAGAGFIELWNQYQSKTGWTFTLLPLAILTTTAFEIYILTPYQQTIGIGWSAGIGVVGIGLALLLFFATKQPKVPNLVATISILSLLIAPLYWSATPLLYGDNAQMPAAGPSERTGFGAFGRQGQRNAGPQNGGPGGESINGELVSYLTEHNTGEKFLFATTSANTAEPYIIQTGKAVIAMGGFSGSDPILTVEKIQQLVADHQVKYFLIPSGTGGFGGPGGGGSSAVLEWIRSHGTEVPSSEWQGSSAQGGGFGMREANALYEVNP